MLSGESDVRKTMCVAVASGAMGVFAYWLYDQSARNSQMNFGSKKTKKTFSIPAQSLGAVIGRNGVGLEAVKAEFGVKIDLSEGKDPDFKVCTVYDAPRADVVDAVIRMKKVIEQQKMNTMTVRVPERFIGKIIGKGGSNIKQKQNAHLVRMKVKDIEGSVDKELEISGPQENVKEAAAALVAEVEEIKRDELDYQHRCRVREQLARRAEEEARGTNDETNER